MIAGVALQIILYSVAAVNLLFSFVIISRGLREQDSISGVFPAAVATISTALWAISLIGFHFFPVESSGINWLIFIHTFGMTTALSFLHFTLSFPQKIYSKKTRNLISLLTAGVFFSILWMFLSTEWITGEITGNSYEINNGYLLYLGMLVTSFFSGYYFLTRQYSKAKTEIQKKQIFYVTTGAILSPILIIIVNVIFPYLGIFDYTWAGPVFTLILITMMFTAMVRFHLFNIKIIVTELLAGIIIVALLSQLFLAETQIEVIATTSVLILVSISSFLLVRSVYREVQQREELAVANKGQENLIHIMNHQIKGYLGKNKGIFAELLSGDYGSFNGIAKKYIEEGLRQSTEGVEYVQTILKGASASKGKLEYDMKPVDVSELVHEVAEDQKSSAEKNDLHFEINIADEDFSTTGDASQLKEALRNLIENAINYSDAGGDVEVSLHKEGGNIVFEVKDTGKGIPEEVKPRLFTPGGRSKDATEYNPNTSGFGLAFVKGVVEAHNGRVDYKPNPDGKGTVFFIELPSS